MKFHHIGYVVSDIEESLQIYKSMFTVKEESEIYIDETQRIRVVFLRLEEFNHLIELVQPIDEKSTVYTFLKKGGGIHHTCYSVQDIEKEVDEAYKKGCIIIKRPFPAEAFGKKRISFVYTKDNCTLEFVEE